MMLPSSFVIMFGVKKPEWWATRTKKDVWWHV